MMNGRFQVFVVKELENHARAINMCAREIIGLGKKTKKLEKGLVLLSASVIFLFIDTRRKYNELLERVEDMKKDDGFFACGTIEKNGADKEEKTEDAKDNEKEEGNERKAEEESGSSFPEW